MNAPTTGHASAPGQGIQRAGPAATRDSAGDADIAIIGAGPAGLHAALVAARAGARVIVLDEYAEPGGQYYKQLAGEFAVADRSRLDRDYTRGDALLAEVQAAGISLMTGSTVWGSFEPGVLEVMQQRRGGSRGCSIRAQRIIVATGAYERPGVFPGWDLPGVMTPGAAQTLVKNQNIVPGRRIVLAGSGPFLWPVARSLIVAGTPPLGIHELTRPADWARHVARLWGHWDRVRDALRYRREFAAAGVGLHFRHIVVRAEGDGMLERVVMSRCDAQGSPVPGTEFRIEADTLCVGYGFIPSVQLTHALGCAHHYDAQSGVWVPTHDADLRTSVPGVLVAGEVAGIGGAYAAMAEGRLAACIALREIGLAVPAAEIERHRQERAHRRAFAGLVNTLFAPRPGVVDTITDDTLVCRCEEVSAGAVRAACRPWGANVNAIKGATRCGMGYCQGRLCGATVEALLARALGREPGSVGHLHPRSPVKPVRVEDLAELTDRMD